MKKKKNLILRSKKRNPTQHGGIPPSVVPQISTLKHTLFSSFLIIMNLMNPKVVVNKDGAKAPGAGGLEYEFFYCFFSSSSSLLFIASEERGEKETSTDVSIQWRQSWCGGEEVNVEVSPWGGMP
jgi:hypothetical protein